MQLLPLVKYLESTSRTTRFACVTETLTAWQIPFIVQEYGTGRNIIIYPTGNGPVVGVSSHFDVVPGSPGANDNGSSMAVCLGVLQKLQEHKFIRFQVAVFFFDEEEVGLKGSQAYINHYGLTNLQSLINLEMLGQGDRFALWQLNENDRGRAIEAFEKVAAEAGFFCGRFDKIVTNYADHVSFREAGLDDAFSVTCISTEDLLVARKFYEAQQKGAGIDILQDIIGQAPLFRHYHQPSDKTEYLNEDSLQMALNAIWGTLMDLDRQ